MNEIQSLLQVSDAIYDNQPAQLNVFFQVIVIKTCKGNVYHITGNAINNIKDMTDSLIEILGKNEDTAIDYILCRMGNREIELPHHYMNQTLLNLNPYNKQSRVILKTLEGYKTLEVITVPPNK